MQTTAHVLTSLLQWASFDLPNCRKRSGRELMRLCKRDKSTSSILTDCFFIPFSVLIYQDILQKKCRLCKSGFKTKRVELQQDKASCHTAKSTEVDVVEGWPPKDGIASY